MREFDRRTTSDVESTLVSSLVDARGVVSSAGVDAWLDQHVPALPLKVQIQTSTRCNAACSMCPYPDITGGPDFVHQRMSESLYQHILDELATQPVDRLSLFLMNEPLLDTRLPEWIAMARSALPDTGIGIFSNGAALSGELAVRLADAGLSELCISVQGFDAETYERTMKGLSYQRLQRTLKDVFERREAGDLGSLHLQIVMGDLPELAETREHADPLYRDQVLLKGFSNERAATGVSPGLASSAGSGRDHAICQRPFVKLYVLANGDCVLCNVDWRRSVVLGRLGQGPDASSISQIWNGAAYRDLRRQHLTARLRSGMLCNRCDYAGVVDHE